jgi:hypothetical protein
MALSGYDTEPYKCLELSSRVLEILQHSSITNQNILEIEESEKNLINPE